MKKYDANTVSDRKASVEQQPSKLLKVKNIPLTEREREILNLISLGFSSNDIAEYLCISKETVKTHRKHLLQKMYATNVAVLVRRGLEFGMIGDA